jgi:hypothetical protein
MAKNAFIKTQYDPDFDYDGCAEMFSKASKSNVTWDRVGDYAYFITDGKPDKVIDAIISKAAEDVLDVAMEAIMQAILFSAGAVSKQERNARLN